VRGAASVGEEEEAAVAADDVVGGNATGYEQNATTGEGLAARKETILSVPSSWWAKLSRYC
jgi:hypothetical protein